MIPLRKLDKETQTIYCKYSLNAKIESMVAKNDAKRDTVSLSQTNEKNTEVHLNPMSAHCFFERQEEV